jgi:hypothetical protein
MTLPQIGSGHGILAGVEAVVVGARIIGLAPQRPRAARPKVCCSKRRHRHRHVVSNSEVIAGLYEPGSLKARCAWTAPHALPLCEERACRTGMDVYRRGSLADAALEAWGGAETNGVGLGPVGAAGLKSFEPDLRASSALHSPSSGIVDSHALMLAYQGDAENAGCTIALRTPVLGAELGASAVTIRTGGAEPFELKAGVLVNAAGLDAWDLAGRLDGLDQATIPPRFLAKGTYFVLIGAKAPFRHQLIYPLPVPGSLGVHLTLDMGGQTRFGPDLEWTDRIDYGRCHPRGLFLRRDPPLLAGAARRRARAGLLWHQAEGYE